MKTIKLLLTISLALAGQVQAQTSNLVTTLVMQFSSAQNLTTPALPLGGSYFFLVTGRWGVGPGDRGEAMADAAWGTVITSTLDQVHNVNCGWYWNGTCTNRPNPDVYHTNHVYRYDFTGRGAAEVLTFTDSYYPDNVGALTFELYEIVQAQNFLTNDLVAYYPFNGNANDVVGTNSGTVDGATLTADRFGQSNRAYYFDGLSKITASDRALPLGNASRTFSLWVNCHTFVTNRAYAIPFKYGNFGTGQGNWINVFTGSDGTGRPIGIVDFDFYNSWTLTTNLVGFNTWQHLVCSLESPSAAKVYINGRIAGAGFVSANTTSSGAMFIGASDTGSIIGEIDDFRIYNRALSASEVQQLYAYESTPPQPPTNGLVAYYPFNGNANDASGNGSNGTMVGTDWRFSNDRFGGSQAALFLNTTSPPTHTFEGAYVSAPRSAALDFTGDFTFSLWVNNISQEVNTETSLISSGNDAAGRVCLTLKMSASVHHGNDGLGLSWGPAGPQDIGEMTPVQNSWRHLVAVRSGTNVILFKDGAVLTNTVATGSPVNGSPIWLGRYQAGWLPFSLFGGIDDVRMYNRALSPDEVQQLYVYESTPATPPPIITSQPVSQTVNQGSPAGFSVSASGTGLGFQWRLNTVNISGATNASYNLASATTNHAGTYAVIVSNAGGSVASSNAVLTVIPPPRTGTGAATLFGVFVVAVNITDGGCGYTNTPLVRLVGGGGSGAQAFAVVSNGVITAITMLNAGYGYTNAPLAVIDPPFIPNPVLDIAPMSFLIFSNLTIGGVYQLQRSVGWYWTNQPVSFTATDPIYTQMVAGVAGSGDYRLALNPVPAQAFATAELDYGFVVHATMTIGGSGYVTSPAVSIVGGGGSNATAVAQISGGVVTSITITDAGIGYTNTPTIQIAAPPAAAVSPTVLPVMRVDAASLAPYNNYQIQFKPALGEAWGNWSGGLFTPTDVTNSQYLFITNSAGFFRLQHLP